MAQPPLTHRAGQSRGERNVRMLTREERQLRIIRAFDEFKSKSPHVVAAVSEASLLICFLAGFTAGHILGAEEASDMVSSLMGGNSPTKEGV